MSDQEKTKEELIDELRELRDLIKGLEASKIKLKRGEAKTESPQLC